MLQNIQDFGAQEIASILHAMAKARYHSSRTPNHKFLQPWRGAHVQRADLAVHRPGHCVH